MPWPKGVPRPNQVQPKGGSRKGIPNKHTADIKEMVVHALSRAGGADYLLRQSEENPVAFLGLVGRVMPLQVTGEGGGPIVIHWESPGDAAKAAALPLVIEHAVTEAEAEAEDDDAR